MFDLVPSVVSDLIAGLVGSGIVGFAAVVLRKVGWRTGRRFAERLGWPFVASVFLGVSLISAILRGGRLSAVVLGALLVVAALVMLLRFGPVRLDLRVVRFIEAYPWRIIAAIFFVASVVLYFTDVEGSDPPDRGERIVFVVALADEELMVMRDILDELEPELEAEVFLMNSKSGRYVGDLDRMVACGDDMTWDLIAVDNNMLGLLAAKELVEELSTYTEYDEIIPLTMLPSLRPLTLFEDEFYFAPFRPNVKIAFYNDDEFVEDGLRPPKTWEDLLHVAEVFQEREGGRVAIQGKPDPKAVSAVTAYEFIKAAGGDPMTLDDDRTMEAFEFLQELKEYLAPQFTQTDWDTANEYLINDAVYLVDNWTFGINVVVGGAGKDEVKAYSGWEGPAREFHVLGGDVLAVPRGAPHPEKAVELIELLLSQETQEKLVSRLSWPPMRLDAYGTVEPKMKPYFDAVRDALAAAEARPNVPQWALVEDILAAAFKGLVIDGEDISALKGYAQRMEEEVPSTYIRHEVKEGDTMESLAERFRTTVQDIARANDIPTWTRICEGQVLLVPPRQFTSQP